MTPTDFPESNAVFGAPADMDENQVRAIRAYLGHCSGGSCDGAPLVVVAWLPSVAELADLINGKPVFLTMLGGLAPHAMTTSFEEARNLA